MAWWAAALASAGSLAPTTRAKAAEPRRAHALQLPPPPPPPPQVAASRSPRPPAALLPRRRRRRLRALLAPAAERPAWRPQLPCTRADLPGTQIERLGRVGLELLRRPAAPTGARRSPRPAADAAARVHQADGRCRPAAAPLTRAPGVGAAARPRPAPADGGTARRWGARRGRGLRGSARRSSSSSRTPLRVHAPGAPHHQVGSTSSHNHSQQVCRLTAGLAEPGAGVPEAKGAHALAVAGQHGAGERDRREHDLRISARSV